MKYIQKVLNLSFHEQTNRTRVTLLCAYMQIGVSAVVVSKWSITKCVYTSLVAISVMKSNQYCKNFAKNLVILELKLFGRYYRCFERCSEYYANSRVVQSF